MLELEVIFSIAIAAVAMLVLVLDELIKEIELEEMESEI